MTDTPQWVTSGEVPYLEALSCMEERVQLIAEERAPEMVWCLEHPPLYTAGTSASPEDLLQKNMFPVYQAGRGGKYTYHGPGQQVVYAMLDLRTRGRDVRRYVFCVEEWVIRTLLCLHVQGVRRSGRVGVWVVEGERESKIAAIGVRVRRWVTYHGLALNVHPDLSHFEGIVPCGYEKERFGVTSLQSLGLSVTLEEVRVLLKETFSEVFGSCP